MGRLSVSIGILLAFYAVFHAFVHSTHEEPFHPNWGQLLGAAGFIGFGILLWFLDFHY